MHEENKTDRRIVKTKKSIRNALANLLTIKNIQDITVKELAATADINRKTFYNYYNSIYEIIDEIEDEIISTLEITLSHRDYKNDFTPWVIFDELTKIINSDIEFYGNLLRMNQNVNLTTKLICTMKERIKIAIASKVEFDEITLNIVINYMITGMFSVYQEWFLSDRKSSLEELARTVQAISFHGILGLSK